MYSKKPHMISVNPHLSLKESNEQVVGKHVTPMAAVEESQSGYERSHQRKCPPRA